MQTMLLQLDVDLDQQLHLLETDLVFRPNRMTWLNIFVQGNVKSRPSLI